MLAFGLDDGEVKVDELERKPYHIYDVVPPCDSWTISRESYLKVRSDLPSSATGLTNWLNTKEKDTQIWNTIRPLDRILNGKLRGVSQTLNKEMNGYHSHFNRVANNQRAHGDIVEPVIDEDDRDDSIADRSRTIKRVTGGVELGRLVVVRSGEDRPNHIRQTHSPGRCQEQDASAGFLDCQCSDYGGDQVVDLQAAV